MDGYYWKWMKPVKICGFSFVPWIVFHTRFQPDTCSRLGPPQWPKHVEKGWQTLLDIQYTLCSSRGPVDSWCSWLRLCKHLNFGEFQVLAGKPQLVWENHFCPCEGSPHLQSVSLLLAFSMEGVDLASKMGFKFIDVYQNLTIQCHNESRVSTFPSILLSICPSI